MWQDTLKNPLVAAGIGGVIGATAGTLISARVLRAKYEAIANEEIASVKAQYKIGEEFSLENMAAQYREEVDTAGYSPTEGAVLVDESAAQRDSIEESQQRAEPVDRSVFGGDLVAFDVDAEDELRAANPNDPYIITKGEFESEESGFEQSTLTYHSGDDVLADARDEAIPNTEFTIGSTENLKFGYGSDDRNVVYIRNPKLRMEWEIVHSDGKFSVDVLGFDDEDAIVHSDRRNRRRNDN